MELGCHQEELWPGLFVGRSRGLSGPLVTDLISAAEAVYREYENIRENWIVGCSGIGGAFLIKIWHPGGPGGI